MELPKNSKVQVMVLNQFVLVGLADDETRALTEKDSNFIVTRLLCSLHTNVDADNNPNGYRLMPEPIPMDLMTDNVQLMSECLNYTNRSGVLCYSEVDLGKEGVEEIGVVKEFLKFWGLV